MRRLNDTGSLRAKNEYRILDEIISSGGISRVELAEKMNMTKGGITPIVSKLLELGIIGEDSEQVCASSRGRRRTLLKVRPNRCFCVAVDFSRTGISAALVNLGHEVISSYRYDFKKEEPTRSLLMTLRRYIKKLLEENKNRLIVGVGVASPGPIDYEKGVILNPPNFTGRKNIHIVSDIREYVDLPVAVYNNAEAHAMAELYCGYGRKISNFIEIIADEGVGGGIILDRRLFRGSSGLGAEFGHISIDVNGEKCECGNTGCVELYASVSRLLCDVNSDLLRACGEGRISSFSRLDYAAFLKELKAGNNYCVRRMEREVFYLGNLLVSLCNIFDPQAIIIGSTLAAAKEMIAAPLAKFVRAHTVTRKDVPVFTSDIENASLIGASIAVFNDFFGGKYGDMEDVLTRGETRA